MKFVVFFFCFLFPYSFAQLDLSTPGGQSVTVTFTSDPLGAEIYVSQTFIGRTPVSVKLNAGVSTSYSVRVPDNNYEQFYGVVNTSRDDTVNVYVPRKAHTNTPVDSSSRTSSNSASSSNSSPMSRSTKAWAMNIFEKVGIVEIDCTVVIENSVCGLYDGYVSLKTMWDLYDDYYDSPMEVTPLTSWKYSEGVYVKSYIVDGEFVFVGYIEDSGYILIKNYVSP